MSRAWQREKTRRECDVIGVASEIEGVNECKLDFAPELAEHQLAHDHE